MGVWPGAMPRGYGKRVCLVPGVCLAQGVCTMVPGCTRVVAVVLYGMVKEGLYRMGGRAPSRTVAQLGLTRGRQGVDVGVWLGAIYAKGLCGAAGPPGQGYGESTFLC